MKTKTFDYLETPINIMSSDWSPLLTLTLWAISDRLEAALRLELSTGMDDEIETVAGEVIWNITGYEL